jgi:hypothetical protein
MAADFRRVQFVVSGPFLFLLLLASGSITAGFYLFTHQPPPMKPQSPPYYVNRVSTGFRACYLCVAPDGKLNAQQEWKMTRVTEIPYGEQWWFTPVLDPPEPVKVGGVPMLAVHPASDNQKPWEGFDEHRVLLVVFQDLDPKFSIEHPASPPTRADTPSPGQSPLQPTQ